MSTRYIPIAEFLQLTSMSALGLLAMLEKGLVGFRSGEAGELLIDLSSISPEDVARRPADFKDKQDSALEELLEEQVAAEVMRALPEIFEEALEMAMRWRFQNYLKNTQTQATDKNVATQK